MKKELDDRLCSIFPVLYKERNLPMTETCMCWGFPGDGWYTLISELSNSISGILNNARSSAIYEYKRANKSDYMTDLSPDILKELRVEEMAVVAEQVKEKFGTLRFYWRGEHLSEKVYAEVLGAVGFAEAMSSHICENCGNPGNTDLAGWITTLCDSCRAASNKKDA